MVFRLSLILRLSLCFLAAAFPVIAQEAAAPGPESLESMIAAHLQPAFNQAKQQIFRQFHPGGTATAITVTDVKITHWAGGEPTRRGADVQQFVVHYTIYWSSFIHHGDGVTEASTVFTVANGQVKAAGSEVTKTNGVTKSTVNKDAGAIFAKLILHI